jgi:hypothetical protein
VISSANALKFSMWLAATHPLAFRTVLNQIKPITRSSTLGMVEGTYIPRSPAALHRFGRGRFGRVGTLGDDTLETVVVQPGTVDEVNTIIDPSTFSDPVLQDINFSSDSVSGPALDLGNAAASVDTAGGFWGSLGSGLSSIGSGLVSAIGAVAGAVTNPQVLSSAGNIAAAVIKNTGSVQQAQLQQAVLQAQLQRTTGGVGAAPVQYRINPATGQPQPYAYNAATGQYQLTQPNALVQGVGLSSYLPYILIGGGILVAVVLMRR